MAKPEEKVRLVGFGDIKKVVIKLNNKVVYDGPGFSNKVIKKE